MLVRRLLIIKTVLVFYSNGCITSPDMEDDESTTACSQCMAAQVAIGADDPNTGAHSFDPTSPTPGVDANGCSTLTYSCSGISAYIEVNDPNLTVGNANSGVQQVTTVLLVCNANNRWQYTGNGNVVVDPVTMLTCLSA